MKATLIIATILFPLYISAYGLAHLLNMKGKEDMPNAKEWFSIAKGEWCVLKGYATSIGYMGYIPDIGYSLFSTETEYVEYYKEMVKCLN